MRREARRRRREGAARPQCSARRPALRHGADRPPRLARELRADGRLRHAPHGRDELPVLGVAAGGGAGEVCADRPRRPARRDALSGRRAACRRREGDAARAAALARAQGGSVVARAGRGAGRRVVARRRRPRADGRRPGEPAARDLGAVEAAAGGCDPRRGFRLVHELVGAHAEAQAPATSRRSRERSRRWGRARRTPLLRSSRTRTAR